MKNMLKRGYTIEIDKQEQTIKVIKTIYFGDYKEKETDNIREIDFTNYDFNSFAYMLKSAMENNCLAIKEKYLGE